MSTTRIYCRLCAEQKTYAEITPVTSQEHLKSTIEKLSTFGLFFVDFSNKMLPNTVCITCYDLLVVSYEFFMKAKRSQVILSELYGLEGRPEIVLDTLSNHEPLKTETNHGYDGEYVQDGIPLFSPYFEAVNKQLPIKEEKYEKADIAIDTKSEELTISPTPKCRITDTWATYPWQCALCDTKLESLKTLREHCRTDHLKCSAFKCVDCDKQLHSFEGFVKHVRKHRASLRNYCEYCNIQIENTTHTSTHMIEENCSFCGEIFNDEISLITHLQQYAATPSGLLAFNVEIIEHNGILNWAQYPSICQFCHLKVVDKDVLSEHCIEAHKKCFGSQCVDCDVRVSCFMDFLKHVKTHRPILRNICPYCNINMGFEDVRHIMEHTDSLHPCTLCGKIFQNKKQLRTHESTQPLPKKKRRRGPTENNSTCQICGMIMKTPATMKNHLKKHTDRSRNYTCDRCGKAYYTKGQLDEHYRIHEKITQEACKICHKTFLTLSRLKKHVKTHNLEMPFQCDACKRVFSSKDRLREHVKVHMDVLPFKCPYCSKEFRHKNIMKTHENQHTGARPYSCKVCCMEFANWSNCNKHMKRKHGTTLAKNVMTPYGKLALNPKTGKPDQLVMDNVVKEWSEKMLGREKKKTVI